MFVAKVVGNVWATRKHGALSARKLMLVRAFNPAGGEFCGETTLAVDGSGCAGVGDTVLVLDEGGSARKILKDDKAPVRTLICGIVDSVNLGGEVKKYA